MNSIESTSKLNLNKCKYTYYSDKFNCSIHSTTTFNISVKLYIELGSFMSQIS